MYVKLLCQDLTLRYSYNMKRIVLSSAQSLASLLMQNPELLSIPTFSSLKGILDQIKEDNKGCACQKKSILNSNKEVFQAAITNIQSSDRERIKSILKVDKVCYYTRNNSGVLELVCP